MPVWPVNLQCTILGQSGRVRTVQRGGREDDKKTQSGQWGILSEFSQFVSDLNWEGLFESKISPTSRFYSDIIEFYWILYNWSCGEWNNWVSRINSPQMTICPDSPDRPFRRLNGGREIVFGEWDMKQTIRLMIQIITIWHLQQLWLAYLLNVFEGFSIWRLAGRLKISSF